MNSSKPILHKRFEACYKDNLHSIRVGQELYRNGNTKDEFCRILEKNMRPVYDSARRQGYEIWNSKLQSLYTIQDTGKTIMVIESVQQQCDVMAGDVIVELDEKPGMLLQDIDLDKVKAVREQLPDIQIRARKEV